MKKHQIFSSFLESQNNSIELLLTVVLIAVGVNILSSGIVGLLNIQHKEIIYIVLGSAISISVVFKIITKKLHSLNHTTHLSGFVIYDEKEKRIISVPEYNISEDMVKYLKAAFVENKAMETLWNQEIIADFKTVNSNQDHHISFVHSCSTDIFVELLEYCIIAKLSTHLTDYYNYTDNLNIQNYQTKDIPELLLSNRFLKLFSEDMDNRSVFMDQDTSKTWKDNTTIAAYSSGAIYKRFELVLPEHSKIIKNGKNEITIDTSLLKMNIKYTFEGFSTVLPSGFNHYYICINDSDCNVQEYKFKVEVMVDYKFKALTASNKKAYYAWIDSFLDSLAGYMGQAEFFERINWNTAYTILRCINNI